MYISICWFSCWPRSWNYSLLRHENTKPKQHKLRISWKRYLTRWQIVLLLLAYQHINLKKETERYEISRKINLSPLNPIETKLFHRIRTIWKFQTLLSRWWKIKCENFCPKSIVGKLGNEQQPIQWSKDSVLTSKHCARRFYGGHILNADSLGNISIALKNLITSAVLFVIHYFHSSVHVANLVGNN